MPTFGSLFAGIGGMDLGFERAGLSCSYQVEINDYANRVLAKHWPDVVRFRDVREVGKHNLPYADVICGGFPCQDISYAGKGAGLAGERSGLWYEFARIVGEMEPSVVVVENVSALLTRGLDAVLGTLASLGYDAQWHCIPAAYVGAPHRRDRVFIVAHADNAGLERRMYSREAGAHRTQRAQQPCGFPALEDWEACAAAIAHRSDDGISGRVDRLKGLGNAIVPQVAQFVAEEFVIPHFTGDPKP